MTNPRRKGYRFEREVVEMLRAHGIPARRVPLSGADPNEPGDIDLGALGLAEAKHRESIGGYLWEWLEGRQVLFLRRNRRPPLVVMRAADWCRLVGGGGDDGRA